MTDNLIRHRHQRPRPLAQNKRTSAHTCAKTNARNGERPAAKGLSATRVSITRISRHFLWCWVVSSQSPRGARAGGKEPANPNETRGALPRAARKGPERPKPAPASRGGPKHDKGGRSTLAAAPTCRRRGPRGVRWSRHQNGAARALVALGDSGGAVQCEGFSLGAVGPGAGVAGPGGSPLGRLRGR